MTADGVPAAVTLAAAPPAVTAAGSGMPIYQLWRGDANYTGDGWGYPAGCYPSLGEAMSAAGHPADVHWHTTAGLPGCLFVTDLAPDPAGPFEVPPWTIEEPAVARQFAASCPPRLLAARTWSPCDQPIIAATASLADPDSAAAWPLPLWLAIDTGIRLAAWYGTGRGEDGNLTTTEIRAALAAAFSAAYPDRAVPTAVIDGLAVTLVRRLCAAGLDITGARTVTMPEPDAGTRTVVFGAETPGSNGGWPGRAERRGRLQRLCAAEARFRTWWRQPVWTAVIPAGRLPWWLCAAVSSAVSRLLLPFGLPFLGVWLTCWPATWHGLAARWVPVAGWIATGLAAEKLAGLELVPAEPAPGWVRDLSGPAREAVIIAATAAAWTAMWPWTAWWAAHLALRVIPTVFCAIVATWLPGQSSTAALPVTEPASKAAGRP